MSVHLFYSSQMLVDEPLLLTTSNINRILYLKILMSMENNTFNLQKTHIIRIVWVPFNQI